MPTDTKVAQDQWERYAYCRDEGGHLEYVRKSRMCEDFFAGLQWDPAIAAELKEQRRPALTINKILGTMSSIFGEQIDLRQEIAYKAAFGAPAGGSDILTKTFRHISGKNQLDWLRSEMFADGCITSRGYVDARMNFDRSLTGDVVISSRNPRNTIPDPDAHEYDPDKWGDVIHTSWMSADDIAVLYSEAKAKELRNRGASAWAFGFDSLDNFRDRFAGDSQLGSVNVAHGDDPTSRMIRVIDRQHRVLSRIKYFVNTRSGDRKEIPGSWDQNKINLFLAQNQVLAVDEVPGRKIQWTVTADDVVLHDKASPYKHFTIVPFFPHFRYGRTIGLVENLIDLQELLNKTTSQELHVVNTMANSGWKVKTGSLKNLTMDELEMTGARTGIVLELDDTKDAEKIQPNQIPQGLDRLSMKAENYIKSVSGRGDAQMGMTRADVSADQIEANNAFGDVSLLKCMDNLRRTDWILARNVRDLVQEFYTDPRILRITNNQLTGEQQEIKINWPDPTTGEIQDDLSMGDYDIEVISQPAKQTLEDSQFEQAAYLKEKLGVPIPDEFLIENSRLINKTALVQGIKAAREGPEAQAQQKIQMLGGQLELANLKADISKTEADAVLKRSKAASELQSMQGQPGEAEAAQQEMLLEQQKHEQKMTQDKEKHDQEMALAVEKARLDAQIKAQQAKEDARLKRAQAILTMKQAAEKPAAGGQEKKAA